ncbi:unnamed protein product [Periconia digitata]|uniref:Uncharacterized protein n=1 Tax=Periconia digitata TaxID=1303443 RepID=A0A9W4UT93_9PLEO|nr:unnamed protein product [Periconia digitata]
MAPSETQPSRNDDWNLLVQAIDTATIQRLQKTLKEICDQSPEAYNIARSKLLIGTAVDANPSEGQKRKHELGVQRYEICEQCEKEYDVEENGEDACAWHAGDLEPDYEAEFWADHDEDCHGVIDSDELRKEYPEGYTWSCYEQRGDVGEFCEHGPHEPTIAKRARVV